MSVRRFIAALLFPIILLNGMPTPALACLLRSCTCGTVTDANLGTTTYNYDPVGNLGEFETPNGIVHNYRYDALNRLTNVTLLGITAPHSPAASYTYTLAAKGRRLGAVYLNGRRSAYAYETLNRLTGETITGDPAGSNGSLTYTYDAVGNRLTRNSTVASLASQSLGYDANDRLTTDNYDANGNTSAGHITTDTNGLQTTAQTVGDSYDSENHLINRNSGAIQIVYDGDGNRVRETQAGVTTAYLVDDRNPTGYAQVIEEVVNNAVTRSYTYGHDLLSEDIHDLNNNTWTAAFHGYDGHGSVRLLTDLNGHLIEAYNYDAFGNLLAVINPLTNQATGANPQSRYLYSGEQLDSGLGLYYLRARYMNAANGRFWTMDSYQGLKIDPLSLHKYLYANCDPINQFDSTGHETLGETLESLSIQAQTFVNSISVHASYLFANVASASATGAITVYNLAIQFAGAGLFLPHTKLHMSLTREKFSRT